MAVAAVIMLTSSCIGDMDNHELYIYEPEVASLLYADQTRDSLSFFTFDGWTITPKCDWIKLTYPEESTYNVSYNSERRYFCCTYLDIDKNTTGRARLGQVDVSSYEYTCGAMYYQMSFLNVSRPTYRIKSYWPNSNYSLPDSVQFVLADSAIWTVDSISFTVQDSWTLESVGESPSWLTLSEEQGKAGSNRVTLGYEINMDTVQRSAKLRLTSSGISTDIDVVQLGITKEQLKRIQEGK